MGRALFGSAAFMTIRKRRGRNVTALSRTAASSQALAGPRAVNERPCGPRWQAACGPSPNHGCAEPTRPEEPVHRRAHLSSIRNAILLRPPIELLAGAMCPRWARDEREVDLGVAVISFNRSEAAQGPRWDRELVPAMA